LPEARWSQTEKALRCEGADRDYRTIEKIHERATIDEKLDMEREKNDGGRRYKIGSKISTIRGGSDDAGREVA